MRRAPIESSVADCKTGSHARNLEVEGTHSAKSEANDPGAGVAGGVMSPPGAVFSREETREPA